MKCRFAFLLCLFVFALGLCGCGRREGASSGKVLYMTLGKPLTTLDPALASDTASQSIVSALYDTPLQYLYTEKLPRKLVPGFLAKMPEISRNGKVYKCTLRDDLFFPPFPGIKKSRATAGDFAFSLLRLADARLLSGGYWLLRGRVKGIEEFREMTRKAGENDVAPYDKGCAGIRVLSDTVLEIHLVSPDPRFIYAFAMPYFSLLSRKGVENHSLNAPSSTAFGSGPFLLKKWTKDYKIELCRNPYFRKEYHKEARKKEERLLPLPLLDSIECYLVRQELSAWLMFLQGELDFCALDGEKFDAVVDRKGELAPALRERGIGMISHPFFEINYIGFHFGDPLLGKNRKLRQAISLAFDKEFRKINSNGRLIPAYSPIPPGTPGHVPSCKGKYGEKNIEKARKLLAEAGYPGGIDPATGKPLVITFDQSGGDTFFRQTAEILASDMRAIGIEIQPLFHNRARFFQKLAQGKSQLFRLSWMGDYPDAENFFQLFYGPNSDSCNRVAYQNRSFDVMYEEARRMPDSPRRTELYEKMSLFLMEECPWIFESIPMAFLLKHGWLTNYIPHDFAFNRLKYLSVDPMERARRKRNFRPLSMAGLREEK